MLVTRGKAFTWTRGHMLHLIRATRHSMRLLQWLHCYAMHPQWLRIYAVQRS
jgi:hypothetical protein